MELSPQEWWWVILSTALLPAAALSIRWSGWQATMNACGRWMRVVGVDRRAHRADPAALARMVRIAATYGPFRARCLPQAMVVWTLLRRHRINAEVKLGVRGGQRGFEAHAWVELAGFPLDRAIESVPFVPLRRVIISEPLTASHDAEL